MTEWQPIETAPEDEKVIIATDLGWIDTAFGTTDEDTGIKTWFWQGGREVHPNNTITHWTPLPGPPSSTSQDTAEKGLCFGRPRT